MKKYEMTDEAETVNGKTLHRIKALKDLWGAKKGDLGGWIEKEANLSQYGDCWVFGNAMVYENASVNRGAQICDEAMIYGHAKISGKAEVRGNSKVHDYVKLRGRAIVLGNSEVYGYIVLDGDVTICRAKVFCDMADCGRAVGR